MTYLHKPNTMQQNVISSPVVWRVRMTQ